jgi:putative tryptophan/tyrosine transport system substrate-binding protein
MTYELPGLINQLRLPAIADERSFAEAGVLMSYSTDAAELARRAANLVWKILNCAKPADLPVELASRFQLIVNMRAARALGLKIPPPILARADELIE